MAGDDDAHHDLAQLEDGVVDRHAHLPLAEDARAARNPHELRQAQTRRNLYNDPQRVEGVLYHRLREGMRDHAQFATQKEKLQRAICETMFD